MAVASNLLYELDAVFVCLDDNTGGSESVSHLGKRRRLAALPALHSLS